MSFRRRLSAIAARIFERGSNKGITEEKGNIGTNVGTPQSLQVTILHVKGNQLIRGETCDTLQEQVGSVLALSQKQIIVVNLENVSRIDETGLRTLYNALRDTRKHGGDLKLICPTGKVYELLRLTALTGVFEVFATEAEALSRLVE